MIFLSAVLECAAALTSKSRRRDKAISSVGKSSPPAALAGILEGISAYRASGRRGSYVIAFDEKNQEFSWIVSLKTAPNAPTLYVQRAFGTKERAFEVVQRMELVPYGLTL